jgi:hypothetical protein
VGGFVEDGHPANAKSVGAAEGCESNLPENPPSQPSAAPTGVGVVAYETTTTKAETSYSIGH